MALPRVSICRQCHGNSNKSTDSVVFLVFAFLIEMQMQVCTWNWRRLMQQTVENERIPEPSRFVQLFPACFHFTWISIEFEIIASRKRLASKLMHHANFNQLNAVFISFFNLLDYSFDAYNTLLATRAFPSVLKRWNFSFPIKKNKPRRKNPLNGACDFF